MPEIQNTSSIVYLVHFDRPLHHARHYIGWTSHVGQRMSRHYSGKGARLLQVLTQRGIGFEIVRTWNAPRSFERKLKASKSAARFCPLCKNGYYERQKNRRRKQEL